METLIERVTIKTLNNGYRWTIGVHCIEIPEIQ